MPQTYRSTCAIGDVDIGWLSIRNTGDVHVNSDGAKFVTECGTWQPLYETHAVAKPSPPITFATVAATCKLVARIPDSAFAPPEPESHRRIEGTLLLDGTVLGTRYHPAPSDVNEGERCMVLGKKYQAHCGWMCAIVQDSTPWVDVPCWDGVPRDANPKEYLAARESAGIEPSTPHVYSGPVAQPVAQPWHEASTCRGVLRELRYRAAKHPPSKPLLDAIEASAVALIDFDTALGKTKQKGWKETDPLDTSPAILAHELGNAVRDGLRFDEVVLHCWKAVDAVKAAGEALNKAFWDKQGRSQ